MDKTRALPDDSIQAALVREKLGQQAFTTMVRSWMARSGWSLQVLSDLCEAALRCTIAREVPDYTAGGNAKGDLVVANSSVWKCVKPVGAGEPSPNKDRPDGRWERVCSLRRLYPSQLHNVQLGKAQLPSATVFDVLGQLNLWLAAIRNGNGQKPVEQRLLEKALQGTVIEDADGPFGPEEMFSVYIGRLQPPFSVTSLTAAQASALSLKLARRIRQGMVEQGYDLVDDWPRFAKAYPSSDQARLAKVRDVAMGLGQWSPEQVKDEEAAVDMALHKLKLADGVKGLEGDGL